MEPRQQPQPNPTTKRKWIDVSEARIPVALVAFFFLVYLLIDAANNRQWEGTAVLAALIAGVIYWLLAPEIRKRR